MGLRLGLVSTYAPTTCGLATFTADLRHALVRDGAEVCVVRVRQDGDATAVRDGVVAELQAGDLDSLLLVQRALRACHAVVVQFEHGIYGGPDGDDVVALLERLAAPVVVVLHTVLRSPSDGQRRVVGRIAERAHVVVVPTDVARRRLLAGYSTAGVPVVVIPHGAALADAVPVLQSPAPRRARPVVLTWGLLGPGKGLEHGIEAFAMVRRLHPPPVYRICGQTHPKVRRRDGESYRNLLVDKAAQLGVEDRVVFDGRYAAPAALAALVRAADLVLLPYESRDQVCSGVLVDAVASGVPVVATRFPHAMELLAAGAGVVVDHDDPVGMALAMEQVLGSPSCARSMQQAGLAAGAVLSWSSVAGRYRALVERLAGPERP